MTTPYHVQIAPLARRQIHALPEKHQKSVIKIIEALAINPRPPGGHKIEGMMGLYKQTLPTVQLVYKIEDQEVLILIVK